MARNGERRIPPDPLAFIPQCVLERRLLWTYHVSTRMERRSISRRMILESPGAYELIESYPEDKYLPSYLIRAEHGDTIFHALFAADVENRNVRGVTADRPDPQEWDPDLRRRNTP